ncbi:CD63 antigen [Hemicordylus capensis]|uniref:CD63 antigen n=1 Tax=Hemicordylus capensis TaxID=884348 RepID=UPI0023032CAD|nr:CD63 antigen [Hemicordylus capensis]
MGLDGGMKCIKFLVVFFNLIFWVCGIALIALGVYALVGVNKTVVATGASGAPIVILVVGLIVFFVSFFGCCGAWKENYCMVTTFAILLTLIFIVEIAAAIFGYIYRNRLNGILDKQVRDYMAVYSNDTLAKTTLDEWQSKFHCCGASNYSDWHSIKTFEPSRVPASCCVHNDTSCVNNQTLGNVYAEGCVPKLEALVRSSIVIVAGVALGIAFFELLGITFACCLMKGIRSGYEVM